MAYRRIARFNKKAPTAYKAGAITKPPYVIYNAHSLPPLLPSETLNPDYHVIRCCFIDPGIKNCAIRISERNSVTKVISTYMQVKLNFVHESLPESSFSDTAYYTNSCNLLDEYIQHIQYCHYIIIESQMVINYDLTRMGQHLITYLICNIKNKGLRPLIVEVDAKLKSRMLGAPTKMKKPQLKKWATEKAIQILTARGDLKIAKLIQDSGKKDDHGDTVCYDEVWWMILDGALHTPPLPKPLVESKHVPGMLQSILKSVPVPVTTPVMALGTSTKSRLIIVKDEAQPQPPKSRLVVVK